MTDRLKRKLADLPSKPGVYLHKDAKGRVLYVGKAKVLRNRVRSYFQKGASHDAKTKILVSKIVDFDIIITRSEVEALLVESNFIKQYRPPYNVVLRDDKQYQFIKVTVGERWPRVTTTRQVSDKQARYFGPYTNAWAVRQSLRTLRKIFPYCLVNDPCDDTSRKRPCLYYHLGLCPSPQYGHISDEDYRATINELMRVLDGNADDIRDRLEREMDECAKARRYEVAAKVRDRLIHLDAMLQQQHVVDTKLSNRDVIGLARDEGHAVVILITVRNGRVVARKQFNFWGTGSSSNSEVLDSFLGQYYKAATNLPRQVLIPFEVGNARVVSDYLSERCGKRVTVEVPKRGDRKRLLELAHTNADEYLKELRREWVQDAERTDAAMSQLVDTLKLPRIPARIECYDISTLTGTSTVGSLVVFNGGKPDKAHYRRFRIRHVKGIDDFAALREVLSRRFGRPARAEQTTDESFGSTPDLIIIDGGKGQVSAAAGVLKDLGLSDIPLIGLAKRLEEIVILDAATGDFTVQQLPKDSQGLYLLQRVRDEAHRFAITYNRAMRSKHTIRSALDDLPGIGPVKKKQLIKTFGSVAKIRQAPLKDIQAVVGKAAGRVVKENL